METIAQRPEGADGAGTGKTRRWSNQVDFFMAAISASVSMWTVWSFPLMAYIHGGGAFLIPYLYAMIILGFPLMTMDLALGQYGRRGPFGVWNLCPLFQGIGWSMCIVSFLLNTYFAMLMAYSIFYMFASFSSTLPWTTCDNVWNTADCGNESYILQGDFTPIAQRPALQYFRYYVLSLPGSSGLDDIGGVQWPLALCLLLAWCLIVAGLSLDTKSWGKLSYVTALLPYGVMLVLLIMACMRTGAGPGILYFITPNFKKLLNEKAWRDAAVLVIYSSNYGTGTFMTISKHNHFKTNPFIAAGILVLVNFFTSILCGIVIFAIFGQIAAQIGVSIDRVFGGANLPFVVYPHAVTALPAPQLCSVLYFLMLTILGLGSAIPWLANILDSLTEEVQMLSSKWNRLITLFGLATVSFLIGLVYTTNGGIHVLVLMDNYVATVSVAVIGLCKVVVVSWIYGSGRLLRNLTTMIGWRPKYLDFFIIVWSIFWRAVCPIAIILVIASISWNWFVGGYGGYLFPKWAKLVGWMVFLCELLPIPVVIIYKLSRTRSRQGLRNLIRPTADWGTEAGTDLRGQNQNAGITDPTPGTGITSQL